jgi:hypothetical protein
MTNHNLTLPVFQSRALLGAGLAALAAAALGSGVYAFQSASASQEVWGIPTDAVTKTVLSFSAEIGVAFGAVVTAWLWRTGRKGLRLQAFLGAAMTIWALAISVGNLSGYFAWTRAQHEVEIVVASDAYRIASERQNTGAYLSRNDEALLRRGEAPSDAERESGDVFKALGMHILILGFGAAYRLPAQQKRKRKRSNKSRAQGKPKLVVNN